MKVMVCGAGRVGTEITMQLISEGHFVTIVDSAESNVNKINATLDVCTVLGNASNPEILEAAGAREANMILAVTQFDEVNMVICKIADAIFNIPIKIGRIRNQFYLNSVNRNRLANELFAIDGIISPEIEIARNILDRFRTPGLTHMVNFANGSVRIFSFRIEQNSPLLNFSIEQVDWFFEQFPHTVIGVIRDNIFIFVDDIDQLMLFDEIYLATDNINHLNLINHLGITSDTTNNMLIVGGGNIGHAIASMFKNESMSSSIAIIEPNNIRAEFLAKNLPQTVILNGSGIDPVILGEAGVSNNTIIAVSDDDKVNILSSLIAKRLGAKRVITLVNNTNDYGGLISALDIDVVISPQNITISSIMSYCHSQIITNMYSISYGYAELLEISVQKDSTVIAKNITKILDHYKVTIIAIVQGDKVNINSKNAILRENDHIILLCKTSDVQQIEKIFSKQL